MSRLGSAAFGAAGVVRVHVSTDPAEQSLAGLQCLGLLVRREPVACHLNHGYLERQLAGASEVFFHDEFQEGVVLDAALLAHRRNFGFILFGPALVTDNNGLPVLG